MQWFKLVLSAGTIIWLGIAFTVLKTHSEAAVSGGITWLSAALSFWESFFCIGTCLGLLVLFREKFNRQIPVTRWLSENSFAVYMFHAPLLIAVTLCLRELAAPKLVKFFCASIIGATITYVASSFVFRRIPLLKRVL
jgi:glucan biosynthesis protein C